MSLFRSESPVLGTTTSVQELSGYGSGQPVLNAYKPGTREIINMAIDAVRNTSAALTGYLFQAPWTCQVVAVRFNCTTVATAGVLSVERIIGDSVAPAAANGSTIILLTASTLTLSGATANTRQNLALSTASGSPLVLNAGDQVAYFLSTSPLALQGGNIQVEIAQIG